MGLFGRRRFDDIVDDDDDSQRKDSKPATSSSSSSAGASSASSSSAKASPKPTAKRNLSYNIDDAIELMRSLPQDNVELVVEVVKRTLESLNIHVSDIIDDATERQDSIRDRASKLKDQIKDLRAQIAERETEIAALERDHSETTRVKERLQLAERLVDGKPIPKDSTPKPLTPKPTPKPMPKPAKPVAKAAPKADDKAPKPVAKRGRPVQQPTPAAKKAKVSVTSGSSSSPSESDVFTKDHGKASSKDAADAADDSASADA